MSKTANKSLIGAFVVGALALLCLAVAVFGSGKLFKQTYAFVLFFDSSVNGLNTGSPVVIQGVPVGRVTNIRLDGGADAMNYRIPVFIELDKNKLATPLAADTDEKSRTEYLNTLVSKGFRGRLAQQSLLTGQLMIELNMYPPEDRGKEITQISYYENFPVIPTVSSPFDSMVDQLIHMPLEQIAQNMLEITENVKLALAADNVKSLPAKLDRLLAQTGEMFSSVSTLSGRSAKLADQLDTQLAAIFKQLDVTIRDVHKVLNPTSLQVLELNRVLREVNEAAKSVRELAAMLNRHPEALLRGKGVSD